MNPGPVVVLPGEDAVELYELLDFVARFIDSDLTRLRESFRRFMGCEGSNLDELQGDLARFIFLLGGPGDRLIEGVYE